MTADLTRRTLPPSWWEPGWTPDLATVAAFEALTPGDPVSVAKWDPHGQESTHYSATVASVPAPRPWVEVVATWSHGSYDVAGLEFRDGDTIREFFSPEHPFNAFAVYAPDGRLRGWYGNVTYPAFVVGTPDAPTIVWQDLYLDVVILPDGTTHLLDDDELADAGLITSNPALHDAITQARQELLAALPGQFA